MASYQLVFFFYFFYFSKRNNEDLLNEYMARIEM